MPPRLTRGGGPAKQNQGQQQPQPPPQQQQQNPSSPQQQPQQQPPPPQHPNQPSHMHHFHQPQQQSTYHQHQHQHHQHQQQRPYVGGSPDRSVYANPPMGPPPQQQGNWGGNVGNGNNNAGSYGGGPNSANNSMYGNPMHPMQHQMGGGQPPMMQQQPYGDDTGYGGPNSIHGSPYPQPGSANNRQQQPHPPPQQQQQQQQQQQRRTPNSSVGPQGGGSGYYGNNNNQGMPPSPHHHQQQQQQQQQQGYRNQGPMPPHLEGPPQQGYGGDGTNSPPPPSPGYRGGGGGSGMRGAGGGGAGGYGNNAGYQGGSNMPPPAMPNNGGPGVPPNQQGMYGATNGNINNGNHGGYMSMPPHQPPPPPPQQQQQQQQQWAGQPQSPAQHPNGYNSAPPPSQLPGMNGAPPPHQQMDLAPPPQQPPAGPMPGRGRGAGGRGGRGTGPNMNHPQAHGMMPGVASSQQPLGGHYHQALHPVPNLMPGQLPPSQPGMPMQPPPTAYGPPPPGVPGGGSMGPNMPPPGPDMGMGAGVPGSMAFGPRGPVPSMPPPGQLGAVPMDYGGEAVDNSSSFFYEFLRRRRLLKEGTLEQFMPANHDPKRQGPVKVAVDGNYMVQLLRGRMQAADPFWFLHSVLPDMLLELVNQEVSKMREKNLEPIWVFQGIGTSGDVEAFLPSSNELRARDAVWEKLTNGLLPDSKAVAEAFDASSSVGSDVIMAIQRFLRDELGVMAVTAPFLNWCQMATFHHEGDAALMVGPPEMLIVPYEPMQVIVEMNLNKNEVAYFDRNEVVRDLFEYYVQGDDTRAAGDRLLDFGLLVATHSTLSTSRAQLTLTPEEIYAELSSPVPHFPSLNEFIGSYENVEDDRQHDRSDRGGAQALKHAKGRTYVTYSAVFSRLMPDCPLVYFKRVLDPSLENKHMANNLSGVFGNFVPLSLFYFQYVGLLSVDMMTIVAQSYFRDEMPVSDSADYRECLPRLVALRSQTLYQITEQLNQDHRIRLEKVSWVRWFEMVLVVVTTPMETIKLDEWVMEESSAADAINSMDLSEVTIETVMSIQPKIPCVAPPYRGARAGTVAGPSGPKFYRTLNETYFAIMLKTFDFLGYFSHNTPDGLFDADGNPVPPQDGEDGAGSADRNGELPVEDTPGQATLYLIEALRAAPVEFHSALIRLSEMARIGQLSAQPCRYFVPNQDEGGEGDMREMQEIHDCEDASEVLLASRIACLISIPYLDNSFDLEDPSFEWTPVYSRHLCTFSVMVRAMNRDLRELVEVLTTAVFVSNYSKVPLSEFATLVPYLPFGDIPSAIGALLLHYVLVFPPDYENHCNTPKERCDYLQEKFKNIPNVAEQLRTVMTFVFIALYFLNAHRSDADETNALSPELQVIGSNGDDLDIIDETLLLMHEKWSQHLDGPAPTDCHGLWPDNCRVARE